MFRVAKNEYVKWITNPKMIIIAVMFIFTYDFVIRELIVAAEKMGEKLQILEGFIGISNSQLLLMMLPVVFIGLMGDFPRMDANAMFYIHRVGRVNWLLGQMIFAAMASGTYLLALLGFSTVTLLGKCSFHNAWSEITTKYYLFAPNEYAGTVANLTTGRLYNNLPPVNAAVHIVLLMFLFFMVIAMLLLVGFVGGAQSAGIVVATGILCIGNVLAYMENRLRWVFPTAHAILELHFDPIYNTPVFDVWLSYVYYVGLLFVLFMVAFLCIDRLDFTKIKELER